MFSYSFEMLYQFVDNTTEVTLVAQDKKHPEILFICVYIYAWFVLSFIGVETVADFYKFVLHIR